MVNPGAHCALSCYNIANGKVEAADVALNYPKTAAYRAPGSPEAAHDVKQQMINRAARIWDIDPENVEFDKGVI